MAATKSDIAAWFDRGINDGATHMLVVCDTFDWEDYPFYVYDGPEAARSAHLRQQGTNMRQVMEVYNLADEKESQLNQHRVFNY